MNLPFIASVLGAERTRSELIPYLMELLEDNEEVVVALAETLGEFLDHVGGPSYGD